MSDETQPKKRNWFKTILKSTIFAAIFFAVIFTVLANLGGTNDMYKSAVEEFISEATGHPAHVKTLNGMTFFPKVGFDFEGVELVQSLENQSTVATAKHIAITLSFWDMAFQTGKLSSIHVEELEAQAGVFMDKAVHIEKLGIEKPEGKAPEFVGTGHIDKYPVRMRMEMQAYGNGAAKSYGFGSERPFSINVGEASIIGTARAKSSATIFEDLDISLKGEKIASGHMRLSNDVEGELTLLEHGSVITPDLKIDYDSVPTKISGDVTSEKFFPADISGDSRLMRFIDYIEAIAFTKKSDDALNLSFADLDVDVDLKAVYAGDVELGALGLAIDLQGEKLDVKPTGRLSAGAISGDVTLDASASPAKLAANINVKGMNYGALQKGVSGTGNALLVLDAQGKTIAALKEGLNGKFSFTGGAGEFGNGLANLWGRGVINSILPSFAEGEALAVNCAIMDFTIEKSLATSNALFIDGTHVTLAGDGTYNIANDNLDILLKPKPKEVTLGKISSAVNIKGSIANPSVSPSLLSLGSKVGGLLLGAVNPAFLAFSLADLGLSEDHPCASYIKAAEDK